VYEAQQLGEFTQATATLGRRHGAALARRGLGHPAVAPEGYCIAASSYNRSEDLGEQRDLEAWMGAAWMGTPEPPSCSFLPGPTGPSRPTSTAGGGGHHPA